MVQIKLPSPKGNIIGGNNVNEIVICKGDDVKSLAQQFVEKNDLQSELIDALEFYLSKKKQESLDKL